MSDITNTKYLFELKRAIWFIFVYSLPKFWLHIMCGKPSSLPKPNSERPNYNSIPEIYTEYLVATMHCFKPAINGIYLTFSGNYNQVKSFYN